MRVGKNKNRKRLIKSYTITELSLEKKGTHGINRALLVKTAGVSNEESDDKILCKSHSSLVKVDEEEGYAWFVIQRGDHRDNDGDKFPLKAHEKAIHDLYNSGFESTKLHTLNEDKSITSSPANYKLGELHIERSPKNIFGVPENTSIGMAMFDKTDPDWKAVKSGQLLTFSFVADINEFEYEDDNNENNILTKNNGDIEMTKDEIQVMIDETLSAQKNSEDKVEDKIEDKVEDKTEDKTETLAKAEHGLTKEEVQEMIDGALKALKDSDDSEEDKLTKTAVAEIIDERLKAHLVKTATDVVNVEPNGFKNYKSIL